MDKFLTKEELETLREAKITSIEDLWQRIGDDVEEGIDQVATQTRVSRARLFDLLISELLREMDKSDGVGVGKWWARLKTHLLDIILFLTLLILVALGLRAGGALSDINSTVGLRTAVIVAASDLEPGRVLKDEDLYTARLIPQNDYFKTGDVIEGLILAKRVPGQKPIRYIDVLRFQVVATADIPVGAQVDHNNIKMSWSPYRLTAFTAADQVIASKARIAIQNGAVVTTEAVESATVSIQPQSRF